MQKNVRKILVIKLRAIGDVVLSTAVIPNLRNAYKKSEIHFLVEGPGQDVLVDNPYIDRIIVLPRQEWETLPKIFAWLEGFRFVKMLRGERYDIVFDLFGNPRSAFLTWVTGASCRVGFNFRGRKYVYNKRVKPRGNEVHEVEFNLDALRALNIPIINNTPLFYFSKNDRNYVDTWIAEKGFNGSFLVGIHPWASWEAKRWDLGKFASLVNCLIENYHASVVLLWGPDERKHAEKVQAMAHYPAAIAPKMTLKELGALLSRCKLMVANDSGPMHIAASVGTPTVGIFGPTQWRLQGPYGKGHRAAYKKGLLCLGCNLLSCPKMSCMRDLDVDEVMEVVEKVITKRNKNSNL